MSSRAVVSRRSVGRTLVKTIGIGAAAALLYHGVQFSRTSLRDWELDRRAASVEQLIAGDNLAKAQAAFDAIDAADTLPPEREEVLRVALTQAAQEHQRKETERRHAQVLQPIRDALDRYDIRTAATALSTAAESGLCDPEELTLFRTKISALQDEGTVYSRLLSQTPAERSAMLTYYLSAFPSGAHIPEVRTILLIDRLEDLLAALQHGDALAQVVVGCEELTALAAQHRSDITLPPKYSAKLLEEAVASYTLPSEVTTETPKGTTLRVRVPPPNANLNWKSDYRTERDATIPIGSAGENLGHVTDDNGGSQWLVRFNDVGRGAWRNDWGTISTYWKDGNNNVAGYRREELETLLPLPSAERFAVDRAYQKLAAALQPHFVPEEP